jgi:hypothetical protein
VKITIESTTSIVNVNGTAARVWQGLTEGGIVVSALVVGIGMEVSPDDPRTEEIAAGLRECVPPLPAVTMMFPSREMLFGGIALCEECGGLAHLGPCGPRTSS